MLVPLWSGQYVELIAPDWDRQQVWDADTRELAEAVGNSDMLFIGWALRVSNVEKLAGVIGGTLGYGEITDADGRRASSWTWLVQIPERPGWPFCIEYHEDLDARLERWRQRHGEARHEDRALGFDSMAVSVQSPSELHEWLGDLSSVGVKVISSEPLGVRHVGVRTASGVKSLPYTR